MSSYAWEGNVERSWDSLQEAPDGTLLSNSQNPIVQRSSSFGFMPDSDRSDAAGKTICRSLIRYMCVLIDGSKAIADTDMRPSRKAVTVDILNEFIVSFFDENPLANMSIVVSTNGKAHKLSDMSASVERHRAATKVFHEGGSFSLENGLHICSSIMHNVPNHAQKEILVLMSSLNTVDPGDIFEEIEHLQQGHTRVSVIGLSAEVHIAKHIASKTQGRYGVCKGKEHYRRLVMEHIPPPPVLAESKNELRCSFIRMGFPSQNVATDMGTATTRLSMCADSRTVHSQGYSCPRCKSINSELPSRCSVCNLELIASSHLARSYHHLFPVRRFLELGSTERLCSGCHILQTTGCFQCPKCENIYCDCCDTFIHDSLHSCKCYSSSIISLINYVGPGCC